jgi:hypothetical protein
MGLFEDILKFGDYFHSIRKHEDYFIVDINIPAHWFYQDLYDKEKIAIKVNSGGAEGTLISFYCRNTLEGVNFLEQEILNIIKLNKDKEEKNHLLQEKTKELEILFQSKNLEELKNINFNVSTPISLPNIENTNGKPKQKSSAVRKPDKKQPEGSKQE